MSFRRDFKPLFNIRLVNHATNLPIPNITVRATDRCLKKLKDFHLLVKQREDGIQVFYSTNPWAASPLLGEISSQVRFDFSIKLPVDFYSRYLPDVDADKRLHLTNLTAAGAIKAGHSVVISGASTISSNDAVLLFPQRFEIEMPKPDDMLSFQLREQFSTDVLYEFTLDELGEGSRIELDLEAVESGRYRLAADNHPTSHTHVLIDNNLAEINCQAIVSIHLQSAQTLAPPQGYQFDARFEAR